MNCTLNGATDWDSKEEMIAAREDCGCLVCEDWLNEFRGEK